MSTPSAYASAFRRVELVGVVDVQTIMDKIADELVNQLPSGSRWTPLGSFEYRSPAQDALGANRYMRLKLTRVDATKLTWKVMTRSGSTVWEGRIHIAGGGSTVQVWCGPMHVAAQSNNAGVFEVAYAAMTDPYPFDLTISPYYIVARTHRLPDNSASSTEANTCHSDDPQGASRYARLVMFSEENGAGYGGIDGLTSGGSQVTEPVEVCMFYEAGVDPYVGVMTQFLLVPPGLGVGVEVPSPIGDGGVGTFEVLGLTSPNGSNAGKLAIRKA